MARMPDLERFAREARPAHPHDRGPHPVPPPDRAPRAPGDRRHTVTPRRRRGPSGARTSTRCSIDGRQFLALVKGDVAGGAPALCRVHAGSTVADVFASTPRDGGRHLREAIAQIEADGRGALVYIALARQHPPRARALRRACERRPADGAPDAAAARVRPRRAGAGRPRAAQDPPPHQQPA